MKYEDVVNTPYTYAGVAARVALWVEAGMEFSNYGDTFSLKPQDNFKTDPLTEGQVMEASLATADTGEKAILWLIAERRRRREERERNRALESTAAAQKKAGDDAIHAARIHRQAEELRCLAAGVSKKSVSDQLE